MNGKDREPMLLLSLQLIQDLELQNGQPEKAGPGAVDYRAQGTMAHLIQTQ